ncbi:MAG: hypothetical protein ACRD59_01330 [Candidatus Acidiferrales bacterium]
MSIFGTPSKGSGGQIANGDAFAAAVNTGAGDLIVVAVGWGSSTIVIDSLSDTAGNTFLPGTRVTNIVGAHQLFYCIGAAANASNIVRTHFHSTGVNYSYIYVWSVPVSGGSAALDVQATGASSSASNHPSTGSFSTTGTDEIVFAGAINDFSGITYTHGTGYAIDGAALVSGLAGTEEATFSSAQTGIVADFSQSSSTDWLIGAMAFMKSTGGGGGSAQPVVCVMQ